METVKKRVQSSAMDEQQALQLCATAEEKLATIIGGLGFLANYTLASVKDIDVLKYRHLKQAKYKHKMVKLVQRFVGLAEEQSIMEAFLDTASVLLIPRDDSSGNYLNLSPFIIDENAFNEKAGIAKLHIFYRYESGSDAYAFKHIYKPDDLPLVVHEQKNYRILKAQFDAFSGLMFHCEMRDV